ncbi:MAG TPA: glycine cleavage system aminomethyltransferase GcvT [Casimicrobiaceae bacterium]|nr:glycine cleavage system aminomethyltransferase GcvT [Casimicrobiaceae bacterium]
MLRETPLHAVHLAAGAKMVDFGGWGMPVSYGSQIEEHHAVRRDAGMFDVSHMLPVDLRGSDVRAFLRNALANNVDKLIVPGKALYSCLLRRDGGVLDDLIVYFLSEDWFRLVVNAATAEKDVAWLTALAAERSSAFAIAPRRDLAMIAVQGPNARERVWQVLPGSRAVSEALKAFTAVELDEYFIARTGYTGEDGFEVMLPATHAAEFWHALAASGVRPCGLGARDTLRLEAGMNLYGQDMTEAENPLESGLAWTVDMKSARDFVGKAALTAPAKRQLVGVLLIDKGGVLRSHQKVHSSAGEGEMTSGSFSPTLGASIGLARLPVGVNAGDHVEVEIRDKRLAARVIKPPFVRNGKSLVT